MHRQPAFSFTRFAVAQALWVCLVEHDKNRPYITVRGDIRPATRKDTP